MAASGSSKVDTNQASTYQCRATQLTPAWNNLLHNEPVALDIEFQNFKDSSSGKWEHRVGRITIVNSEGVPVLDVYAAYAKTDGGFKLMPPSRFGVTKKNLLYSNGAVAGYKVERWVKQIVQNRTVVVHAQKHDLAAFQIEKDVFATSKIIDTQQLYSYLQPHDGTPGLSTAASAILSLSIQQLGQHSPVEDAQTTMKLWHRMDNSYDGDAELAKIKAAKDAKFKAPKSDSRGGRASRDGRTRGNRSHGQAVEQQSDDQVVNQMLDLDIKDGNEFPALGAPSKKR